MFAKSLELRAIINNILRVKQSLSDNNALYKSYYSFLDYIYFPKTQSDISYARIRSYKKSGWQHKSILLTIKSDQKTILKQEYDLLDDAKNAIKEGFDYAFQFSREGWEYEWEGCHVFLEDIQDLPASIEVIAESRQLIDRLFLIVQAHEVLEVAVPFFYLKLHERML